MKRYLTLTETAAFLNIPEASIPSYVPKQPKTNRHGEPLYSQYYLRRVVADRDKLASWKGEPPAGEQIDNCIVHCPLRGKFRMRLAVRGRMWSSGIIAPPTARELFVHYPYKYGILISVRTKYVKEDPAPLFE